MDLPIYQVDAFTASVFGGNPAAVVPLEYWLPDKVMQAIAAENNLSETAFFVPEADGWHLRWFTPTVEVDLCGHATLATAFVLFERFGITAPGVAFHTRSGRLEVLREGDHLVLDFPARPASPGPVPEGIGEALGAAPCEVLRAAGPGLLMAVFDNAADVRKLVPDMGRIAGLAPFAVMVTAPGDGGCDFVSRFFAPAQGVPEDPVTGSAHCTLVPYWSARLGRTRLHARQVSARGGELFCEDRGERVRIGGRAVLYLEGRVAV
ncbi:MAG: PhzF family phenazine biosynthesis protein [Rhodospirillales bacterium]|nr:PhzF family phenazine biosynthesis protein [Rhodospirillales bacterium]